MLKNVATICGLPLQEMHIQGRVESLLVVKDSVLLLRRLPGRLDSQQTADVLGFCSHEIPILTKAGLLRPLGRPAPNGQKFFCAAEILEHCQDRDWLDKATRAVTRCWQDKNRRSQQAEEIAA